MRGINNIAIESDCAFAVPRDTWTNNEVHVTTTEEKNDPRNAKYAKNGPYPESIIEEKEFLGHNKRCKRVEKAQFVGG